jgi:hypothetical protein
MYQHNMTPTNKITPLNTLLPVLMLCLAILACTKTTPFGADLLSDQLADYDFTDTISMEITVEREDSVKTSDRGVNLPYFLCGEVNDPVFGKYSSDIYTLLQLGRFAPNFDTAKFKVDSVVMYLRYDAGSTYGDTTQPQTLSVFRLNDPVVYDQTYYSTQSLGAGEELGSVTFKPRPRSLDTLFSSSTRAAYLRVPLANSFAEQLFNLDSLQLVSDTAFYSFLRGLKIVSSNSGSGPGAMLSFQLNEPNYSRVRLFYSERDTAVRYSFDFYFQGANKFTSYKHNYENTAPGALIGQKAQDLMYVHGMQGLKLKVRFPYIANLDNIAVNDADLVFTVAQAPNDDPALLPAKQLSLMDYFNDSTLFYTNDVVYSLGPTLGGSFNAFGGAPLDEKDNGTDVVRYRLALSDILQDMIDGKSQSFNNNTVFVRVYPEGRSPMRAILHGPKSATFPAKLALKYTRL